MFRLISRMNKIATGTALIIFSMLFGDQYSFIILLSLAAIPIIFLGMFDWHPTEFFISKISEMAEKKMGHAAWKAGSTKTTLAA